MDNKKTTSSKWEFFGAVYQHGSSKAEYLQEALPHWSLLQIEKYIQSYRLRAQRKLKDSRKLEVSDDECIDLWHDFIINCHHIEGTSNRLISKIPKRKKTPLRAVQLPVSTDYSFFLSRAMKYAAYFEDHYQGQSPDDPNYNEIYRYLGQLLAGEEPVQLRPGNAAKILEMISNLKEVIESPDNVQRYLNYLTNQHKVSFIKLGVDPVAVAEEKAETSADNQVEADEQCQEYLNSCSRDAELINLNLNDANYSSKRENSILKLSLKQRAMAKTLTFMPGVNPMELPTESLVKPANSVIKPVVNKKRKLKDTES